MTMKASKTSDVMRARIKAHAPRLLFAIIKGKDLLYVQLPPRTGYGADSTGRSRPTIGKGLSVMLTQVTQVSLLLLLLASPRI